MRVLFVCRPLTGHFEPLVPVARACADAGHAVAFATGEPVDEVARERGFEAFAAGLGAPARATWAGRIPANPERVWFLTEIFAKFERPPRARDLTRLVEQWRPDLLVHDLAELATPMVANAAGLPYASAGFGVVPSEDALAAVAAITGLPAGGLFRHLFLDPYPRSLQRPWVDDLPAVQRVAPALVAADPPPWLAALPHPRTVYLTMGTVWNRDPARFTAILDDLAGQPFNVVVTTGAELDLGPQPPHVRVERFIPQAAILPHCAAVICHGGAGTVLGALAYGRPLLLLPQGADQFDNAEGVVAAGAGLVSGDVRALLDDPSYARAAGRIADEIAAMPPPSAAVAALAALVTGPMDRAG